mgnify:FL=1|tara:strand:+ start:1386 stop:1598 length:213 start_codon:yes stop_codon:yes gene_type:complete
MKVEDLKQELYDYLASQKLTEEEVKVVDIYIGNLLETFGKVLKAQEKVLNNSEELEKFKNLVLENMEKGD